MSIDCNICGHSASSESEFLEHEAFIGKHVAKLAGVLWLIKHGLEQGRIKSAPMIFVDDDAEQAPIQSLADIVDRALLPYAELSR